MTAFLWLQMCIDLFTFSYVRLEPAFDRIASALPSAIQKNVLLFKTGQRRSVSLSCALNRLLDRGTGTYMKLILSQRLYTCKRCFNSHIKSGFIGFFDKVYSTDLVQFQFIAHIQFFGPISAFAKT